MTAAAADLLGNIAGVINGTATVVAPLDGFYGVDGEAIDELEGTSLDGCGQACDALDACVAWDFADSCTRYGTLLSFSPRNGSRAGHKGFRRAGLSSAILTQSVDTETECDGMLTYDRRIAKYDREPLRAAVATSKRPIKFWPRGGLSTDLPSSPRASATATGTRSARADIGRWQATGTRSRTHSQV